MPHQGHFSLGIEGLALLRLWLVGDDQAAAGRIADVGSIVDWLRENGRGYSRVTPESDVRDGYSAYAESYDSAANLFTSLEEPALRAVLQGIQPGRALDAACGTGRHLAWLESSGHAAIGIDLTPAMMAKAVERGVASPLCAADLHSLPFATDTFDVSLCALALTHCQGLTGPIAELARVTRPGGRVVLSDIHPFAVLTGAHASHRGPGGLTTFIRNETHLHSAYLTAFQSAGLRVLECIEPRVGESEIDLIAKKGIATDPTVLDAEAYRQALLGVPAILIWNLQCETAQ